MPKVNPDIQPVPATKIMTADEASTAIANYLIGTLETLGAVLDALMPGSAPGRPDNVGDGLLNHLDYCRQLADSAALHADRIADMIGARNH